MHYFICTSSSQHPRWLHLNIYLIFISLFVLLCSVFLFFFNNENENISPPPTNTFIFWTFVAVASSLCPPSAASCARSKLTTLKLRALIGSRCRLRPWTGPARVTSKETWHTDWPEERCSCACGRSLCDSERVFFIIIICCEAHLCVAHGNQAARWVSAVSYLSDRDNWIRSVTFCFQLIW